MSLGGDRRCPVQPRAWNWRTRRKRSRLMSQHFQISHRIRVLASLLWYNLLLKRLMLWNRTDKHSSLCLQRTRSSDLLPRTKWSCSTYHSTNHHSTTTSTYSRIRWSSHGNNNSGRIMELLMMLLLLLLKYIRIDHRTHHRWCACNSRCWKNGGWLWRASFVHSCLRRCNKRSRRRNSWELTRGDLANFWQTRKRRLQRLHYSLLLVHIEFLFYRGKQKPN